MTHTATCHCGSIRLELDDLPDHATACTCSYCARIGALWSYHDQDEVRIIAADTLGEYSASEGINQHFFCTSCGVTTHGLSPDWTGAGMDGPKRIQINLRTIADLDLKALRIEEIDGKNLW